MKLLLVGPYPPPHGGVSVHVAEARRHLIAAGLDCRVLNIGRGAPESSEYLTRRGPLSLFGKILRHAIGGWTVHVHTNGHNLKSWLTAAIAAVAALPAPARLLTLHSGMAAGYMSRAPLWRRVLVSATCRLYSRIICVNPELRDAVQERGVSSARIDVLPAFLPAVPGELPARAREFCERHAPVLSTALFFRPEYGFDLLVAAVARLRRAHPKLGCIAMGSGEQQEQARELLAREGLAESILLAGDLPRESCLAVMARSDVFVRPTLTDGDANSVREALALGVPAVASDVGVRPPGTRLFPAGDTDALVAAVEDALAAARSAPSLQSGPERLLDLYVRCSAGILARAPSERPTANARDRI